MRQTEQVELRLAGIPPSMVRGKFYIGQRVRLGQVEWRITKFIGDTVGLARIGAGWETSRYVLSTLLKPTWT